MVLQDAVHRLSKDDCELLIAHMVQRGILQLDFGFTAYATNTYLKAAPRALQMLAGVTSQQHQYLMTKQDLAHTDRQHCFSQWQAMRHVAFVTCCWNLSIVQVSRAYHIVLLHT